MPPALELQAIEKRFGAVHALRGAEFALKSGQCHALLGENGAGKSTLMHIAYGLLAADSGSTLVEGVPRTIRSPRIARGLGIGMVHQHFTSVPAFTVAENIALAAGWKPTHANLVAQARALMEKTNLRVDPNQVTGDLSVAEKQRVEILKALAGDARILLLDEPTAVLSPAETTELFDVVRRFTSSGGAVVFITHKLEEALRVADSVTVLRRGATIYSGPAAGLDASFLAAQMIGPDRSGWSRQASGPRSPGAVLVRCSGIDVARQPGTGLAVRSATLEIHAGEIVSVAAVQGNGQRELLRAVAGLLPIQGGILEVAGPVAFIPEDRTTEGLIPSLSLTANVVLGVGREAAWVTPPWIHWAQAEERTAELISRFDIRALGPEAPVSQLSGGNQQKLIIARALELQPRVIVAEQPTRGLDLRSTARVHEFLRMSASTGAAVLVYSSDLDEVLALGDRRFAMADGGLTPAPNTADRAALGALMLGGTR